MRPVAGLRPFPGNARQHSKRQVRQIADSITRFGFTNPILISDDGEIVAGHGRVMAARALGLEAVPTLRLSSVGAKRMEELAMHPTVKPVALVADAIRDCSRRGETVLDIFGGSGSTLIAAEICGRTARLLEYDPAYCDTIITRWETYTGKRATLNGDGRPFEEIADVRLNTARARPQRAAKRRAS